MSQRSTIVLLMISLIVIILLVVIPAAGAAVSVATVAPPTPSTKLRLFVHLFTVVSSEIRQGARWPTSHEDYLANTISSIEKAGFYEVVSANDVRAAVGDQDISYSQMERNDWGLAREIGKGLHADYVLVVTRKKQKGMLGVEFHFQAVMINSGTGKNFKTGYTMDSAISADVKELAERNKQAYRTIFSLAKEDLLAAAVKKSRSFVPRASAPPMKPEPPVAAPNQGPGESAKKVLVCDFDSNEQYLTVAMILTEALRDELLTQKKFFLADQDELQKARKHTAAQGAEPMNEKQAVALGKEVAADQVVTGRLGFDGEAFVVQAKRTGVEAGTSFGRASLTFKAGQENEVMEKLPGFAKELMAL